ncbi:hypothetical protein RhiirA4_508424 [Rhizophagus irregularis]|uniref:Uncharacterized protein n=1 Tax=Rhizophagus irregularis TaxID=588596 RepID=A0A2I1HDC7_9GLOM|nr:hypothetical protein RhiirA4_508424 [Rhizophagus irregularis]
MAMGLHKDVDFWFPDTRELGGKEFLRENIIRINNENIYKLKLYLVLQESFFNLGCGTYQKSTLVGSLTLESGDTKGVFLEFGKWVYGGGKKLPGFVRRRNAKRDLFCKSEEGT